MARPPWLFRADRLDGKAGLPPFGEAVLEPTGSEPMLSQQFHCLNGEHAIRPATVGDDGLVSRDLPKLLLKVFQRHRNRSRYMTGFVFGGRPDVENSHFPILGELPQS